MTFVEKARSLFGKGPRPMRFSADGVPRPVADLIHEMTYGTGRVSRAEALSVGAIKRGRDIICGLATLPLDTIDLARNVVPYTLFEQIDPNVPNAVVLSQTLEDLLFEAVSWWQITAFDEGWPTHARHLDISQVTVNSPADGRTPAPLPSGLDPRGEILVDGKPVNPAFIVMFSSLNTPLLRDGGRAVRRAVALDKAAEMYANDPRPMDFFTPTDPKADPGEDEDITAALDQWRYWRRRRQTGYVPAAMQYNVVQQPTPADLQLVGLQQRAAVDIANMIGLDPDDVGVPVSSDTYNNAVDRRQDRINNVLSIYATALTGRLSMGDVTQPGHKVRLNYDGYLRADPKTRIEVAEKQLALGLITTDEYREKEGLPALTSEQRNEIRAAVRVQSTVGKPVKEIEAA